MAKYDLLLSASAVTIALAPQLSFAQAAPANPASSPQANTPTQLRDTGDIIVTARKRNEAIQDVPAVVSALSGNLAEDLGGVQSSRDAVALVPGVTMIEGSSGAVAEPNIRGAGQARLPNSDSAIGLYRDGAYIVGGNLGGRTFQRFDFFDLNRMEVLRGPQGALYGRNAVGGAINVITRTPELEKFSGEATLLAGSQRDYGSQMILNVPVSSTFALRGGFDIERQKGGFYYNTVTDSVQDPSYYAAGRLSARFRPSPNFDIVLTGDYAYQDQDVGSTIQRPDPDRDIFAVQFNTPNRQTSKQYNVSLGITWNLGFGNLVSTSNFRKRDTTLLADNDGGNTVTEVNGYLDDAQTFFQELRLQGEEDRFNWLVGADFFSLKDEYDQTQSGRALIITPAMGMTPAAVVNPNIFQNTDYKQTGYSGFASLEYKVTDAFSLEGEGRFSVDDKSLLIDARRADGTPRYADFPPGSPQTMPSDTYHNFSFGTTASYKIDADILAFARVATAYRSGGFNSELGNPCGPGEIPGTSCNVIDVPATYNPEHSINYEIGLKTGWFDRRLFLNANVYRINYSDILANLNNGIMAMADPLNGAMFLANAGDAHAFGFEVEMNARTRLPGHLGRIEFGGSIAHQAGDFTSINPAIKTVLVGNELARLRPFSYNGSVVWHLPLGNGYQLTTSTNFIYEDGGFIDAENTLNLDTTRRANARLALAKGPYELSFLVENVFNNRYFINQAGTAINGIGENYRINDPRSFRVSVKVKW